MSQFPRHHRVPNWLMFVLVVILGAIFSVTYWQYVEAKGALIEKQKQERP